VSRLTTVATVEQEIPGYSYGAAPQASLVTSDDLAGLRATTMLDSADEAALRRAGDLLEPQVEAILDVWYGFVGSNPHLLAYFSSPEGEPLPDYLGRVRTRFGQWILDTCRRTYDQEWLDQQHEIGLRHTRQKKNTTDGAEYAAWCKAVTLQVALWSQPYCAAGDW
jgi:hypothetical protein